MAVLSHKSPSKLKVANRNVWNHIIVNKLSQLTIK